MTTAIYPGRFDPVTAGHLDILQRASYLFENVVMAVFEAPQKQTMFSTEERVQLIREAAAGLSNVEVRSFSGLVVDYAQAQGATAIVRGIRMHADFESEFEMALMNRKLAPNVDVVCLMTDGRYQFVRASLLKEVAMLGGDIRGLAPDNVIAALAERFGQQR
ncbi:MAG: pantetheine-phosphate adenylyltransferase [Chloroflexi bacterium]|nr:pantetheine-phosphate adenylyltransferase [Chloroflexota bacterium]MYA50360.1 pantetheine-phosphate adenylyltransferase [Chloroflexota bacterium]MYB85549.1 pantetheine-phosphate adenylyltransferase [Chloroflexota bacterium]MYK35247.1 pantetheine-phosphate adenylyltransferase [Chloroflexota bacterium]